jgi:hypothetical protein
MEPWMSSDLVGDDGRWFEAGGLAGETGMEGRDVVINITFIDGSPIS